MSTNNNVSATVRVDAIASMTDPLNIGTRGLSLSNSYIYNITNGTSSAQANTVWSDTRTLAASASENLDLNGVLTDAFGNTVNFTKVIGFIINAHSSNTNNVLVGGAGVGAFVNWISTTAATVTVRPGGTLALMSQDSTAYAVTPTTGDLLAITNSSSGTSVTYDITIFGVQ